MKYYHLKQMKDFVLYCILAIIENVNGHIHMKGIKSPLLL